MEKILYQGKSIYDAALKGDFPLVVLIWGMAAAQRISPFLPDDDQNTAVHYAAVGGNVEIIHFFAQQAVLVNPNSMVIMDAQNNTGETPLIRAAHAGNVLAVKVLVDLGSNILKKDSNGNTAAHHAAHQGHIWALHYLLEAQVDITEVPGGQCYLSRDVLQWACEGGQEAIVDYILERGHDPNIPDNEGRTALHHAILDTDKPLIKKLLAFGAKSDTSDERGLTALSTANNMRRHTIVNILLDSSHNQHNTLKNFTFPRHTRIQVMLLYSILWFGCLMLSLIAPWYIFTPALIVFLFVAMKSMSRSSHKHGKKQTEKLSFAPQVTLTPVRQTRGSVFEIQENIEEMRQLKAETVNMPLNPMVQIWTWFTSQPEIAIGLWFGWLVGFNVCLGYRIYIDIEVPSAFDFWNNNIILLLVLLVVEFICLISWIVLVFSNPGHVATASDDFPKMLQQAATGFAPGDTTHCTTCMIKKPIRSKHCASCGICVSRMDHHCVWINKCVGYGNHRLFISFLWLHLIVLGFFLILFYKYVTLSNDYLEILLRNSLPELTVIFWATMSCIFVGKLLWDQSKNIWCNMTLNESINWKRYPYLNSGDASTLSNPFDQGGCANLSEFWTHSLDYLTLFSLPTKETINKKE